MRAKESARRKAGLGERTAAGETIKATPAGRQPRRPNRETEPRGRVGAKARRPRAENARRRTTRDNPP